MADLDPTLAKLTSIEDLLRDVLTGRTNTYEQKSGESVLGGPKSLTEQVLEALKENTRHLGTLTSLMGGRTGGMGAANAATPHPGGIGASAFRLNYDPASTEVGTHLRYGNIPRAISTAVNGMIKDNRTLGYVGGAINNLTGAVPAIRNEFNNINAQMQASVDRRITNPTQLGMLSGLQGPGSQNVSSAAGSYFSSMFAAPSLVLSGGMNPNKIGSFFGQSMSPATSQGWQSQYRAFTRSLNPFDMLSNTQALGINQAVAKKGFANMGQQINIEQAVTDIVQSVGIDAGAAIDTMDLAVKRLHLSVSDASDLLKDFGQLAIGAGKGVSQFAQESNAVTAGISTKGAIGQGALAAGAAYSSFSQVSGQAAMSYLNGPQVSGLMAAGIMGGGGKFASPENMMLLAMGGAQAMAGGEDAMGVFGQQVTTVSNLIDTFKKQGLSENVAIQMAASQTGEEFLTVKQIYKQGPKIVKQQNVLSSAKQLKDANADWIGSPKRRRDNAVTGEGKAAFKEFQREKGIDWDKFSIGDSKSGPDFNEKVRAYYDAKMNNDSEGVREALRGLGGAETDRVRRAGDLLFGSDPSKKGNRANWKTVTSEFGVRMGYLSGVPGTGNMGATMWDSTNLTEADRKKSTGAYLDMATPLLNEAREAGIITQNQEKGYLKRIRTGDRSLSPSDLHDKLNNSVAQKRIKDEGGIQISLTPAAKRYLELTDRKGGKSIDGTLAVEVPNGTNNRNMLPTLPEVMGGRPGV